MGSTLDLVGSDGAPAAARPSVAEISALPFSTVFDRLDSERRPKAMRLLEWLWSPRLRRPLSSIINELCERMLDAGLPLDRYSSSTIMVTADYDGVGRIWYRDQGVEESYYIRPEGDDPTYLTSPLYESAQSKRWLEIWLPETLDERFGVVAEFRAKGLVHYVCVPATLSNEADAWVTFATKRPSGFSEQDLLTIAYIVPAMTVRMDARVGWQLVDKFLRTYVGDEPHQAIVNGRAKRGQVTIIPAAMMIADLRDSTGHMAALGAIAAVDLFNRLFDCLVPAVESHRGEILKYLGDGLLAIFRDTPNGASPAERALAASEAALAAVDAANKARDGQRRMEIGIALHYGEAAYGNIGSGSRLDFTVIGPDVALASRIAGMNGPLGVPLLMSAPFAARLPHKPFRVGAFPARGFDKAIEVFQPEAPTT